MRLIFGLVGLAYQVQGLAFAGPQPTATEDSLARALKGSSPIPTEAPNFELFKRDRAFANTCGWYSDDFGSETITCGLGTCMLFTPSGIVGMAGCCTSSAGGGGMDYQDNLVQVNQCYDYTDYKAGDCDASCQANAFHKVCTDVAKPYCLSWTYPGPAVRDYGCGTDPASTWITVEGAVADFSDTISASLPYVPAAATVTGWQLNAKAASASGSTTYGVPKYTSSSSSSTKASTGIAVAVIAIIVVVAILSLCCVGGLIAWFCIRHKRNVAKFNTPAAPVGDVGASASHMQAQQSNVMIPGQNQQSGYFDQQQQAQQTGAAAAYYGSEEQKLNPQTQVHPVSSPMSAPGTPAPPYQQPYQNPNQYNQPPAPQNREVYEMHSNPSHRTGGGRIAELG